MSEGHESMEPMKEALYYRKQPKRCVQCLLCPKNCLIENGRTGFCRARKNTKGVLHSLVYEKTTGIAIDPIEKKPLYHYHPRETVLSLGTRGCNFACVFCQNWHISQNPDAYLEYVTSDSIVQEALAELLPYIGAMNIDLKALDDEFYRTICKGTLAPVLQTIETAQKVCHVELTNLVIPTLNDSDDHFRALTDWIYDHCGADTPLHFSRYFPSHREASFRN